jgi:hypothetical protein
VNRHDDDRHGIEAGEGASVWWTTALYWVCWLFLLALLAHAVWRMV